MSDDRPSSRTTSEATSVGADAAIAAGLAHQGSLASESALQLFALAAVMQANGRLTLGPPGRTYALTFRRGTVEHAASSDPEDELGRFLLRRGALSGDALARAEARRPAFGGDLVSALISERLVNPAEVAALLQEHGSGVVLRALAVEAGGWSWSPQAAPPPGAFPLGPPYAMLCAAARSLDAAAVIRRLDGREHRAASRTGGRMRLEDLRLTPQEARAAALFDSVRSPAELAEANPGEALTILRLAALLGEVGLLSFGAARAPSSRGAAAPAPPAAAARPPSAAQGSGAPVRTTPAPGRVPAPAPSARARAPAAPARPPAAAPARGPAGPGQPARPPAPRAAPASPPQAPPRAALDVASLEALRGKLAAADHFAVLGVSKDATGPQIKAAYFQLAKLYHPDAIPADAAPEVRRLCADLFAKASEAWSVLGDERSRAGYLDELKGGGAAEVDVMRIFEAERAFQAGTLLVKARRFAEGLRKFEEAIALNSDEPEFGMWRSWCEFLLAADKRKQLAPASAAVETGLRKNPRCAQGYLFLGQMAKIAGDLALAERHLRRGLQVAPEHPDLQRELKYLRR